MRKIKFRAWDIQTESMRDVLVIDWVNELIDLSGGIIERRPHEAILMQSTDLEDKNGVEIYERDIVRVFDAKQINQLGRDGAYVDAYLDELDEVDFIVFKDGGFVLNRTGLDVSICQSIEEFTVIGNIHENPELPEESK